MSTGKKIYDLARQHIGERYSYSHVEVPKDDPNWKGPWDCSELASWALYQVSKILYGCKDNHVPPSKANAFTGYWNRDSKDLGIRISIKKAARTKGGVVLRSPVGLKGGHVAISNGNGRTIEANSSKKGVVKDKISGRRWDTGILIPGIKYTTSSVSIDYECPTNIYRVTHPFMKSPRIKEIQKVLESKGYPGNTDGIFGYCTYYAVLVFQSDEGIVADGEVGSETLEALYR